MVRPLSKATDSDAKKAIHADRFFRDFRNAFPRQIMHENLRESVNRPEGFLGSADSLGKRFELFELFSEFENFLPVGNFHEVFRLE